MGFFKTPEQRRWYIVVTIFIAIICNYLDRQLLSILKPTIKDFFEIGDDGYASIINVFMICYAIMYPISGWLVDKFGPKKVMFWGIFAWSIACIGGGLSANVTQFTIFRGLLGLAEPTIFAGQIVAVTVWFSGKQRATVNSLCAAGGSIGTVIAPILIAWMAQHFPWQDIFIIAGSAGVLIAVAWHFVYINPPQYILDITLADEAKKHTGKAFSWLGLWKTKSLYGVILIRFISDPVWYFCLFWLPGYLQEDSGLTLQQVGWIGWIPFFIGAVGGVLTSAWSDKMVKKGKDPLWSRRIMMSIVAFFTLVCALVPFVHSVILIILIFSIIGVVCLSWLFTINVVIAETFPVKNVASVVGITAGFGAIGGAVFNYYVGQLIGSVGAELLFFIMSVLHLICVAILWKMIRPEDPKTLKIN